MTLLQTFNKALVSEKAPHYAQITFDPSKIFEYFYLVPLTAKRKVYTPQGYKEQSVNLSLENQKAIFEKLSSMIDIIPCVIGISSDKTDYLAVSTAGVMLYNMFQRNPTMSFGWVNSGYNYTHPKLKKGLDVVVIYNIIPDHPERIYEIRDLITYYNNSLRIVVFGGMPALQYFDSVLKMPISGAIHIASCKSIKRFGVTERTKTGKDATAEVPMFTHQMNQLLKDAKDQFKRGY